MSFIDLRSDTVTVPSRRMRDCMRDAEVGDDVYAEDPTVKLLEEKAAALTGKEAALFVTSGTMGNLTALLSHDIHGFGVIAGRESHIFSYEGGGVSVLAGALCQQVDDGPGLPVVSDMEFIYRSGGNDHHAPTKLLCLENTHNRRGGTASSVSEMRACTDWARGKGMSVHLDGARIFNAAAACGESVSDYCALVDSVQICLSKGLGAPVGSVVCGTADFIVRARGWRKRLGGGLRQVGIIAAAGIYALDNNVGRLADDHANAAAVKDILGGSKRGLKTLGVPRPTNMVYFDIKDASKSGAFLAACAERGVRFNATAPARFRLVFHLNVSREDALKAADIILEEAERIDV